MRLRDFTVLSFDCYGTLIDWETGLLDAFQSLVARARRSGLNRNEELETFARWESRLEAENPQMNYRDILSNVYKNVAAEWNIEADEQEATTFAASIAHWPPFADSGAALQYLSASFPKFWCAFLFSVQRSMF